MWVDTCYLSFLCSSVLLSVYICLSDKRTEEQKLFMAEMYPIGLDVYRGDATMCLCK